MSSFLFLPFSPTHLLDENTSYSSQKGSPHLSYYQNWQKNKSICSSKNKPIVLLHPLFLDIKPEDVAYKGLPSTKKGHLDYDSGLLIFSPHRKAEILTVNEAGGSICLMLNTMIYFCIFAPPSIRK